MPSLPNSVPDIRTLQRIIYAEAWEERAALRCAWLSVHSRDKSVCVVPIVIGENWRETAEATAQVAQVPCLQPILRLREAEDGWRYPDDIDAWQPLAGFDARLRYWLRAVLPADNA